MSKEETFRDRLLQEQVDLMVKIKKLVEFINSDKIKTIDTVQRSLLLIQLNAMKTYHQCLIERVTWLELNDIG